MGKLTGLWLLLAALNVALTDGAVVYFTDGGQLTIEVRPAFKDHITSLLWMFNGDLLAEWNEKLIPLTYYRTFKDRANLSTDTGQLVINHMSKADQGVFSVNINGKIQSETYTAKLIKKVPKPRVLIRPLTCTVESERCNATCDADIVGAEPVTYSWKKGEGEWMESKNVIFITKTQDAGMETLTCQIRNPVSEEKSDPINNTLYNPAADTTGDIVGGVLGVLLVIGVVVVLGGLFVARKKKIGPFRDRSTNSTDPASGNGQPTSHPNDASAKPAEELPLKANPQDPNSDVQQP